MNTKNKTLRRLFTASMSSALIISLASCSGASDNTGKLNTEDVYASAGDYKVYVKDIWNELKWDSKDVLDDQINLVILNKYIKRIETALSKEYASLTDEDAQIFGYENKTGLTETIYKELQDKYKTRLVDYVVQDIYNLDFKSESNWDGLDSLGDTTTNLLEAKYVDEIFSTYYVSEINKTPLAELIDYEAIKDTDKRDANYLAVAKELSQVYYPQYAKELFAYDKLEEDIQEKIDTYLEEAEDDDTKDPDDAKYAYFSSSEYVSKFKSNFTMNYDVDAIIINFATSDELDQTLKAFGLKVNNKKLYYIKDSSSNGKYSLDADGYMSYENYLKYYSDFSSSDLSKGQENVIRVDNQAVLEVYIQLYNYVYGGYREKLASNYSFSTDSTQLNNLRKLTYEILEKYSSGDPDELLANAIATLKAENYEETHYTDDEIEDIDASFKTYVYDTLTLEPGKCYTTTSQTTSAGETLAYKFGENIQSLSHEEYESYAKWYNSDRSSLEIIDFIEDTETNPILKSRIDDLLRIGAMTESKMNTYLNTAKEDIKVQVYNEATEIAYSVENDSYSKTVKKNKNKNVLATIEYDDYTWNLNIVADEEDDHSLTIPGKDEKSNAFGVYDYLEAQSGATTAIDLLSNQLIKNTKAYEDTAEDRQLFENYVETILYNFSNGGYASSGYDASIGKYKFLMLYFHTADINDVIDNFYRVQYASLNILADYSSDELINFFQNYVQVATENYFSLSGTRFVVYFDEDEDGEADDISTWPQGTITAEQSTVFAGKTYEEVAKQLIYDVYQKVSANTGSHVDTVTSLVDEINNSARVAFEQNIISPENSWAAYRHLGLKVKTEELSATNSSLDIDFNIKQRLFDYARGYSEVDGQKTATYEFYKNTTTPTCYIEKITEKAVSTSNDTIVESKDGYNLLFITGGTAGASAKWSKDDHDEGILENIVIKYNSEYITIKDIYNEEDALNKNQILLYVLDAAVNSESTLAPASLSSAYTAFLAPVVTRFQGTETQRIILLNYIGVNTNQNDKSLKEIVTFHNENANVSSTAENFAKVLELNERVADNYISDKNVYDDTTGTSYLYTDWWTEIQKMVQNILIKDEGASK